MEEKPCFTREVSITVEDYFAMLEDELIGRHYNKTAHGWALYAWLDGRTEGAVEFRHQNISAVLVRRETLYQGLKAVGEFSTFAGRQGGDFFGTTWRGIRADRGAFRHAKCCQFLFISGYNFAAEPEFFTYKRVFERNSDR